MARRPEASIGRPQFGAPRFAPTIAVDFGGPAGRFAEAVRRRFALAEPLDAPAERVFAVEEGASVSISPQINVDVTIESDVAAHEPPGDAPRRLDYVREHVRTHTERVVERRLEGMPAPPPQRFYEKVIERFARAEPPRGESVGPAPLEMRQPPGAPRSEEARPDRQPAQFVLHRPKSEAVKVETPTVRRLPESLMPTGSRSGMSTKEIGRVADEVISLLNRQSIAWRERFGRS